MTRSNSVVPSPPDTSTDAPLGFIYRAKRWTKWQAHQLPTVVWRWAADRSLPAHRQPEVLRTHRLRETELLVVDEPAAIEPRYGYAVHGRLGVIDDSLPLSSFVRSRQTRMYLSEFPSPWSLTRRHEVVTVPGLALSLRHPYEENYFHATVDCVGRLATYEAMGLLEENTVVIGTGLAGTSLWQELNEAGALAGIRVVVQEQGWVRGEAGVAYVRPARDRAALVRLSAMLLDALPDASSDGPAVRLLVRRGSGQGRLLRQEQSIADRLAGLGFVAIDPGTLRWREQADLFRRVELVVGVHGAALTNIIFRAGLPLHLVEIHAPGGNETMYAQMAGRLGYGYTHLEGINASEAGNRADFDIDPDEVVEAIDRILPAQLNGCSA